MPGTQFACFTSTTVQILTCEDAGTSPNAHMRECVRAQNPGDVQDDYSGGGVCVCVCVCVHKHLYTYTQDHYLGVFRGEKRMLTYADVC